MLRKACLLAYAFWLVAGYEQACAAPLSVTGVVITGDTEFHPGDTLSFTATLHAGVSAGSVVVAGVINNPAQGQTIATIKSQPLSNLASGASIPVTLSYTIPVNGSGFGTFALTVFASDQSTKQVAWYPKKLTFTVTPKGNTSLPAMHLTLDEEFNEKDGLNTKIWSPFFPVGEIFGTSSFVADEYEMLPQGGIRLRSDKKPFNGHPVSSGVITSFGGFSQTYGYFEMKARMPAHGKGLWPAFWLLPANQGWPPEIDVLEWLGATPERAFTTLHYVGGKGSTGGVCKGEDFSDGYHTFAVAWRPGSLIWFVDGKECFDVTENVPEKPMYILANFATGGWEGNIDEDTPFPSYFDIATIKVYQFDGMPAEVLPDFQFGKTFLLDQAGQVIPYGRPLKPGETINVSTTARMGDNDLANINMHAEIFGYLSKTRYAETPYVPQGAQAAHSVKTFQLPITLPSDLKPGVYSVAVQLSMNAKMTTWLWVAQQFVVSP